MSNGMLTSAQLESVDGVHLAPAAASAWHAMVVACQRATGVRLKIALPFGGYRSLVAQRYMHKHQAQYGIGIATPGYSTHGLGLAVDVTIPTYTAARTWLLANCARYGFAPPPPNDRNHFAHRGTTPSGGITMASVTDIWGRLVNRGGKKITAIQELADAKTNTILILERVQALEVRLSKLTTPAPLPLTAANVTAIAASVAAQLKVPTKGTITLS